MRVFASLIAVAIATAGVCAASVSSGVQLDTRGADDIKARIYVRGG